MTVNLELLREALKQRLGQQLTPQTAGWIEAFATFEPDLAHDPAKFGTKECMGYVFAVERLRDIVDEIHPLHETHFKETQKHRLGFGLDVDYDAMLRDERAGRMLQFTLRLAGALVGNIRMYIAKSRHTGTLYASEDTFYVLLEHRKGLLAIRFWQFMEDSVRAVGVREIRTDSSLLNRVDRLNEYCGYAAIATKFVKVFEE